MDEWETKKIGKVAKKKKILIDAEKNLVLGTALFGFRCFNALRHWLIRYNTYLFSHFLPSKI